MRRNELIDKINKKNNSARELRPLFADTRMSIEITNICNHKCVFCPAHSLTKRQRRFIDDTLCRRILIEGFDLGVRELTFHILGEPLLNPHLIEYVEYANNIGYTYIYLTTNGSLATPDKIDALIMSGIHSIKFSVNAAKRESYAKIHGVDNFDKVKENIMYCNKAREKYKKNITIYISCVLTNETKSEIQELKSCFGDIVDSMAFYAAINRGGLMKNSESINNDLNIQSDTMCFQPFNAVCVSAEGFLSPCCMDSDLKLNMGDLQDNSLRDLYYSDKFIDFRDKHLHNRLDGLQCAACLKNGSGWLKVFNDKE
jgi:pyruvate-formate lyase-activating enzyme